MCAASSSGAAVISVVTSDDDPDLVAGSEVVSSPADVAGSDVVSGTVIAAGELVEQVREERQEHAQALLDRRGRTGEIDDHRTAGGDPHEAAGQHRGRGVLRSLAAQGFSESGKLPLKQYDRPLRGQIPRADPGAARRDDDSGTVGQDAEEGVCDGLDAVGDDQGSRDRETASG